MLNRKKNKYGQYFTPEQVVDFMIALASVPKNANILDPCCGKGIFQKRLNHFGYKNTVGYEIDPTLECDTESKVHFKSFIGEEIDKEFDLIIGNPPYIRWKNLEISLKKELQRNPLWNEYFNSLCDYSYIFILKSIELLKEKGQLIFITPEYWVSTKHSQTLRDYMVSNGYFEEIYHFNETPMFDKVTSSILIFKYIKLNKESSNRPKIYLTKYHSSKKISSNALKAILRKENHVKNVEYIKRKQFPLHKRWVFANSDVEKELERFENICSYNNEGMLFPSLNQQRYHTLGEIADIGNGMVSGLDKAFQVPSYLILNQKEEIATLRVLKAKNISTFYHGILTTYIFIQDSIGETELKTEYPNFYHHFLKYKDKLNNRYNYRREIKYWEWVFLRNYNLFSKKQSRIFVPCKERISHKNFFRFCFVREGIYPTQDVTAIFLKPGTNESIFYILALLNNFRVFKWLKLKGVIKGEIVEFSEKPLNSIPVRLINWKNDVEVHLHEQISALCKEYIKSKDNAKLQQMNEIINELF